MGDGVERERAEGKRRGGMSGYKKQRGGRGREEERTRQGDEGGWERAGKRASKKCLKSEIVLQGCLWGGLCHRRWEVDWILWY